MKQKLKKTALILLFLSCTLRANITVQKKTVIFAFCNVLYNVDEDIAEQYTKKKLKWRETGILGIQWFLNSNFKEKQKEKFFAMLDKLDSTSSSEQTDLFSNNKKLPSFITQYLKKQNEDEENELYEKVKKTIRESNDYTDTDKKILDASARFTFTQEGTIESLTPDKEFLNFAKKLKTEGYDIRLAANISGSTWEYFTRNKDDNDELFTIFPEEKQYISGLIGATCPSKKFFNKVLGYDTAKKSYSTNPKQYIYIDSEKEHFAYPKKLGITCYTKQDALEELQ